MRRRLFRLAIVVALLLLTAMGAVAWFGGGALVSPPRRHVQDYHRRILDDPAAHGLEIRDLDLVAGTPCHLYLPSEQPGVARKSRDLRAALRRQGLHPPAWGETAGTLILLHGHTGIKEDHLPIAERFAAAGFACVAIDLPGHGKHSADHASFGAREVELLAALRGELIAEHGLRPPFGLFGISQGGAIALQTAARHPDAFYAVASVATFDELDTAIDRAVDQFHPASRRLQPLSGRLVRLGARVRAGFDPSEIRPITAAAALTRPVFIGHGERDRFLSSESAHALHAAVPHGMKTLRLVPDGGHGDVLAKGGNAFYTDIAAFFLTHLPLHQASDQTASDGGI